ncbi:MAG: sodium/solute symporter [Candidatus Eisenbacteria bacterium]|nr:sodium/solute symporter [Candidatus Eisenbacteria bacterium]
MDPVLIGFIGYLFLVVVVGLIAFRFTKTLADFLLAGRRLGAWVVAFSERASGESAWLLIGLPGLALASGFSAIWSSIGCAIGIFASWTLVARRLREQTEKLGALTLPDYFEARFRDSSHVLRIVSMAIIVFFFTFYVSAQFLAAGKVLHTTFGLEPLWGMAIGAIIILFYTIMGGFFAVAWTDLVQGILMAFAMIILPVAAWIEMGGTAGIAERIAAVDPDLLTVTGGETGRSLIMGLVIGSLGIGLGYVGQPHLLTRFMAIRRSKDLRKGTLIAMSWVVIAFWGAVLVGIAGLAYFGPDALTDSEHVMPEVAKAFLPAGLAGVIISAAIAAMMSTADSQLLVATSALSEDIYHQLVNREASQRRLVALSRIGTLVIGAVAFILARRAEETVYWFVLYAWAGLGAAFGPGMVLSLWWKRTTKWGVLAGMIVGAATSVIWHNVEALKEIVYELVPAFVLALIAVVVVSLLTRPSERGVESGP